MAVALLIALSWPHPPASFRTHPPKVPRAVRPFRRRIAGWTLHVRYDGFTGQRLCKLSSARIDYNPGYLTFRFPERVDTSAATYRVDLGYVRTWSAARIDLIKLGAPLQVDRVDNPSGGRVPIPLSYLDGAKSVMIRAAARGRMRTFDISGFPAAMAAAQKAGCDPVKSFLR